MARALRGTLDGGATLDDGCASVDEFVQTNERAIRSFWYVGYADPQFDVEGACLPSEYSAGVNQ